MLVYNYNIPAARAGCSPLAKASAGAMRKCLSKIPAGKPLPVMVHLFFSRMLLFDKSGEPNKTGLLLYGERFTAGFYREYLDKVKEDIAGAPAIAVVVNEGNQHVGDWLKSFYSGTALMVHTQGKEVVLQNEEKDCSFEHLAGLFQQSGIKSLRFFGELGNIFEENEKKVRAGCVDRLSETFKPFIGAEVDDRLVFPGYDFTVSEEIMEENRSLLKDPPEGSELDGRIVRQSIMRNMCRLDRNRRLYRSRWIRSEDG